MKTDALIAVAAASLVIGLSVASCAAADRHSPDAHMDQNADRYRYTYDDGVCHYEYQYDFKELTDHLDQHGDCRDVPIQRYRPQAAIAPAYPPPAAAPPVGAPTPPGTVSAAPAVTRGAPSAVPSPPPGASSDITVTPLR
jgi:hypothetical protein